MSQSSTEANRQIIENDPHYQVMDYTFYAFLQSRQTGYVITWFAGDYAVGNKPQENVNGVVTFIRPVTGSYEGSGIRTPTGPIRATLAEILVDSGVDASFIASPEAKESKTVSDDTATISEGKAREEKKERETKERDIKATAPTKASAPDSRSTSVSGESGSTPSENRNIILNDPHYHGDFTYKQAEDFLKGKPPGSYVIRPVPGYDHFMMHWVGSSGDNNNSLAILPVALGFICPYSRGERTFATISDYLIRRCRAPALTKIAVPISGVAAPAKISAASESKERETKERETKETPAQTAVPQAMAPARRWEAPRKIEASAKSEAPAKETLPTYPYVPASTFLSGLEESFYSRDRVRLPRRLNLPQGDFYEPVGSSIFGFSDDAWSGFLNGLVQERQRGLRNLIFGNEEKKEGEDKELKEKETPQIPLTPEEGNERQIKILNEINDHLDFKPTMTGTDAEAALEYTFSEKFIIIPNHDETYECYVRVPPLTSHQTFDPRKLETLKSFLEKTKNKLKSEVQQRKDAMEFDQKQNDETNIAQRRETAMRQLSGHQIGLLQAVREKYGEKMKKMGGVEAVLKKFQEYLESKYNEHFEKLINFWEGRLKELEECNKQWKILRDSGGSPEEIKKLEDKIVILSMVQMIYLRAKEKYPNIYKDKKLPLNFEPKTAEDRFFLSAYFLNPYHTAWRYFQNPNPWINKNAIFAASTFDPVAKRNVVTHADITPESRSDLALLWLAATDESTPCIKGFTNESMMEFFTKAVALIARGHNWDKMDAMQEGPAKKKRIEEMMLEWGEITDDLMYDNPSCSMGVNQRLIESIMGNPISERPETRPLDPTVVRMKYAELLASKFYEYVDNILKTVEKPEMDKKARLEAKLSFLKQLPDWYERRYVLYEELLPEQKMFFDDFRLNSKEIREAIKELRNMFGDRFEWLDMRTDTEHYSSYAHYFSSLNEGDPWAKAAVERLLEQIRTRIQNLEKELQQLKPAEDKKEKEVKMLHAFERRAEGEEPAPKRPRPATPKGSS